MDLLIKLQEWLCPKCKYKEYEDIILYKNSEIDRKDNALKRDSVLIADLRSLIREQKDDILVRNLIINKLEDMQMPQEELEGYLNNKHPKIEKLYLRHETDQDYKIDVRNYIMPYDSQIPTVEGNTFDEIAYNSLLWVIKNIKYRTDKKEFGETEYWAYSYQTIKHGKDDCDGGSILMYNIMLKSGIPYYKMRINCGMVRGGGHAYLSYCRDTDKQWVVLDWCYAPNKKKIKDRLTHKEERNYINKDKNYNIWFSFNQKYIFGKITDKMKLDNKFIR